MAPTIVVEDLTKVFENRRGGERFVAVDHVSFVVQQGEIFGFLGPNGAGKTTTIRMLLGLMRPTSGKIEVLGYQQPQEAKAVHAQTGYMSQLFTLYNDLTARENIRFYGQAYGLSLRELRQREEMLIELAGLKGRENELVAHLSGGWRQRLALGCAIIHDPALIFLDEPTAGVDPVSRRAFWELIYGVAREGTTIFVTTHYMDEAELCQRLAFINRGRIVREGTPEGLKAHYAWGQVLELECDQPEAAMQVLRAAQVRRAVDIRELSFYGSQIHIVGTEGLTVQQAIQQVLSEAGLQWIRLEIIEPTLEDVFIASMREQNSEISSMEQET